MSRSHPRPVGTTSSDDDDPQARRGGGAEGEPTSEPALDVRSGGHAGSAPKSLTEAEARWQEHESSGASWDDRDSI